MSETPKPLADDFPPADAKRWRDLVDKILKGADFERRLVSRTADGIKIRPVYRAEDTGGGSAAIGIRAATGADMGWDIRQVQVGSDPSEVNAAVLDDLTGGASSVLLTVAGGDKPGLAANARTLAKALDGVLLDVCPVAFEAGPAAPEAAASIDEVWRAQGIGADKQRAAINFDPVGSAVVSGRAIGDLRPAADLVAWSLGRPHVTALAADGTVYHRGGATEAQELGAVLATIVAYLRAAEKAGVAPDQALGKIALRIAVDADEILGIAKLRAVRLLVDRIAAATGVGESARRVSISAETSLRMMTKRDPWVNMLRTTMACASAALGGADSVTVYPFTWAIGAPDAFARRMARNTSIVLQEESGLGRVADPAAGSYAIEAVTRDLAAMAWAEFQAIEKAGGILAALGAGDVQGRIAAAADARRKALATGRIAMSGTSAFPLLGSDGVKVAPWPATASPNGVGSVTPIPERRDAAAFEALRDAADAHEANGGSRPRVFLATLGPLAVHGTRAIWIRNFLAAGGIDGLMGGELTASQDAGARFAESGAHVACICSSDAVYGELGEATVMALKGAGAKAVFVAGRPKGLDDALTAAGADGFIAAGDDMIETLGRIQRVAGVA
ncbi:MAG TPA: methylmalonyl-CoA mutase family protein [Hyphomicrobiaceae bacterium]|nr:methylmalonyl-CoA mutase family protein [Hyphomicrobiaceae bacterium]